MPRDLPSAVTTQKDAANKRPVLLFELGLSSIVRLVAGNVNVVFPTAGNTYSAKNIKISGISQSLEGQIGRITVKFDNVSRDMSAYENLEDFRGKSLVIKRVYLDALGNAANYNEVFNGYMETPTDIDKHWLTAPATIGKPLTRKSLSFAYQRMCPWVFGDDKTCNSDGNADLTQATYYRSGTADSGTSSSFISSGLHTFTDFWKDGQVFLVKGGVTYKRRVKSFNNTTNEIILDVGLTITIDNTTTYTVFKGCDQTLVTCSSSPSTPGPNTDNSLNFGGCIHITSRQDGGS